MASTEPPPEELLNNNNNTETDEGTIALQKKRSRRVSFAENTSIHVFDRDEEDQTPPDPKPNTAIGGGNDAPVMDDEMLDFLRNLGVGNDFNDLPSDAKECDSTADNDEGEDGDDCDGDSEVMNGRKLFFRSAETPSPGSTVGSATPHGDEEDFFGPVEPNFIRPGRYSDSGVSEDDNREATMDTTAFSVHFRSLARSESEVDLATPSGINLSIEQKMPTMYANTAETGRAMVLTGDKKYILSSPLIVDKGSHTRDSNDMSLEGENSNRYDYSKLSPRLEALLADDNTDLLMSTPNYPTKESETPRVGIEQNSETNLKDYVEVEPVNDGFHDSLVEAATFPNTELSNDNGFSAVPIDDMVHTSDDGLGEHVSFPIHAHSSDHINQENYQFNPSKDAIDDELETDRSKTKGGDTNGCDKEDTLLQHDGPISHGSDQLRQSSLTAIKSSITEQRHANSPRNKIPNYDTEQNFIPNNQSALAEVGSSLSVKDWKAIFDSGNSARQQTPEKLIGSILRQEIIRQIRSSLSIQKSISKLNILSDSPYISSLQDKDGRLRRRLSNVFSTDSSDSYSVDPKNKDGDPVTVPLEKQLLEKDQKNAEYVTLTNVNSSNLQIPKTLKKTIQTPETSTKFENAEPAVISSSPLTMSGLKMSHYLSVSSATTSLEETIMQYGNDLQKEAEAFNLQTPLRKIDSSNNKVGNPDESLQTVKGTEPDVPKMTLRGGKTLSSSGPSASPLVSKGSTMVSLLKKGLRSPSIKHTADVSHTDNVHHGIKSPNGHKRRRGELVLKNKDQIQETSSIQHSPRIQQEGLSNSTILLKKMNEINGGEVKVAAHLSLKDSFEILSRFSAESETLHSPLMDKLNLRALGVLEDILVHMQKVKKFEMFYSQIQSQKASANSNDLRHKRVSERRALLCKMVYERAKLQIMQKKRERLLEKANKLTPGTQECLKLKMDYFQDLSVPCTKVAQVDDSLHHSFRVHAGSKHAVPDVITTMNQEVEVLERKIKHSTQNFHTLINVKGELSPTETVLLVKEHLNKKICCRSIRQDLQTWKVDCFESIKGQHNVVLNYHGFVYQRFTLSASASNINVVNEINEANILKKFPNMDACTAFAFVVKTESQRESSNGRYIAQETQVMSSLLCNLLDVVEDVCQARLDLSNLTDANFHCPSAEQLDLKLHFREHKSGEMLSLTLDMSCLKCGVYPNEVSSSLLEYSTKRELGDEVRGAIEGLKKGGYSRISSLLKCISQTLDAFFNNQVRV